MKSIIKSAIFAVALFAGNTLHAQETPLIPSSPTNLPSLESYSDAQLEEVMNELAAMPLIWPTNLPNGGAGITYWSLAHPDWPPLPTSSGTPFWNLTPSDSAAPISRSAISSDPTASASSSGFYLLDDVDYPPIPGTNSDGGTNIIYFQPMIQPINTNSLWLQITNVANNIVFANLNRASDAVYEIYSTTNLAVATTAVSNWDIETEVFPVNTNTTPFNVPMNGRSNLFLWARDWTGITSDGNTVPEWWLWEYLETVNISDANLDSLGQNTLLYDFENGFDPNVVQFSLQFTNDYFYANPISGAVSIQTGEPSYVAVLVNDANFNDAVWQPLTSTNLSFIENRII
jgi:hypothetical protein